MKRTNYSRNVKKFYKALVKFEGDVREAALYAARKYNLNAAVNHDAFCDAVSDVRANFDFED